MRTIKFRAWDLDALDRMYSWDEIKLHFNEHLEHERVVTMQFTGLHDKNGREIYEGDILTGTNYDIAKPRKFKGEVIYDWNSFVVKAEGLPKYDLNKTLEVIGNIYENPELLK